MKAALMKIIVTLALNTDSEDFSDKCRDCKTKLKN